MVRFHLYIWRNLANIDLNRPIPHLFKNRVSVRKFEEEC